MAIVGVRLLPAALVRYFDPADLDLEVGDRVVVDCGSGPEEGVVVVAPHQVLYSEVRGPLPPILHKLGSQETKSPASGDANQRSTMT